MNIEKYDALGSDDLVVVWDNERKKQTAISKLDFDADREADQNRYVFAGKKGFFQDNNTGEVIPVDTDDFYSFYDDKVNYRYLDSDKLEVAVTPQDKLRTGEKVRDFLPNNKVGTAVSNVWDALVSNFTLGFAGDQTRKEELAEERLRSEAGGVGATGTVAGQIAGIIGTTVATGGVGTVLAKGAQAIKFAPKVAKSAKAIHNYLKTGKGLKHTAAVGAGYSVPWSVATAIQQKDVGKGVETMMWGTLIPFGGHAIGRGVARSGGAVKSRVAKSFFNIPKTKKFFEKGKEKLASAVTIDPDFIPEQQFLKMASKLKKGDVDLSSGLTPKVKKEIIQKASRDDILNLHTEIMKRANEAVTGRYVLPKSLESAYRVMKDYQSKTGKEVGEFRNISRKYPKLLNVKGSEMKETLKGLIPGVSRGAKGKITFPDDELIPKKDKAAIKELYNYIEKIQEGKSYSLFEMKKIIDNFSDLSDWGRWHNLKFKHKLYRKAYGGMVKLEERAISNAEKVIKEGGIDDKLIPEVSKTLKNFKRKKSEFASSKQLEKALNYVDQFSGSGIKAGTQRGLNVIQSSILYGGGFGGGFAVGGVGGAVAFAALLGGIKGGVQKGVFLKPLDTIGKNIEKIANFGSRLTLKKPKEVAAVTISQISKTMLGIENEEEDLNQLVAGLSSSMQNPYMNNQGSSRAILDGTYTQLRMNTNQRKLSLAKSYTRLETTLLKNAKIIKKNDPEAKKKKEEFLEAVSVLFSPDALEQHIQDNTLTETHVRNFKQTYPRLYDKMRRQILADNEKNPLIDRLDWNSVATLSKFVGIDLTGLGNYRQPVEVSPEQQQEASQKGNPYKFGKVSADLRKQIFDQKTKTQMAEAF